MNVDSPYKSIESWCLEQRVHSYWTLKPVASSSLSWFLSLSEPLDWKSGIHTDMARVYLFALLCDLVAVSSWAHGIVLGWDLPVPQTVPKYAQTSGCVFTKSLTSVLLLLLLKKGAALWNCRLVIGEIDGVLKRKNYSAFTFNFHLHLLGEQVLFGGWISINGTMFYL